MDQTLRIRLTKKLAAILNGVDVSTIQAGDIIELPLRSAPMMIAEGWAERVTEASTPELTQALPS